MPGQVHDPGHRLRDAVEARLFGQRVVLAIAGETRHHEARIELGQDVPAAAHLLHRAGTEILDENVGFRHQPAQQILRFGVTEIEGKAPLVAVEHHEIDALSLDVGPEAAGVVPEPRPLHFDDLGTEVAQHHGAVRTSDET